MKILICTNNKLIDFYLKQTLSSHGLLDSFSTFANMCDPGCEDQLEEVFAVFKPTAVINVDDHVDIKLNKGANTREIKNNIHKNMMGVINLLKLSERFKIGKFIQIVSTACYFKTEDKYLYENHIWGGPAVDAKCQYRDFYRFLMSSLVGSKILSNLVVCENLCGNMIDTGHMGSAFLNDIKDGLMVSKHQKNHYFKILCDELKKDFVHIKDVSRAISKLLLSDINNEVINVGSGSLYELKSIVDYMKHLLGYDGEILVESTKRSEAQALCIDKAKQMLDWQPEISLEDYLTESLTPPKKEQEKDQ